MGNDAGRGLTSKRRSGLQMRTGLYQVPGLGHGRQLDAIRQVIGTCASDPDTVRPRYLAAMYTA